MSENIPAANTKKYKIIIGVLSAVIVVLVIMLIMSNSKVNTFIIEKDKAVAETQTMQKQLDSLVTEHEKIKKEYGNMTRDLAKKDSTIQSNATEIQKLIAANAGSRQIKKKLDYLRGITQDYVDQIDKLLKENQELKTEIADVQQNYSKEKEYATTLAKDKEDLSQQITKAAVLTAYNISVQGIRFKSGNKEEIVDKARRTEKLRISFIVGKNPLVTSGTKEVFVRIARPDNAILQEGQSFEYNGQQIMYSLKATINYQQKPVPITLYYEKSDRIVPGTYNIALFTDGQEIGEAQCTLN